jgi:membrane protein
VVGLCYLLRYPCWQISGIGLYHQVVPRPDEVCSSDVGMKNINLSRLWTVPTNVLREAWFLLVKTVEAWIYDGAMRMAAALSFYTIFSIGPILLIALSIAETIVDGAAARTELTTILGSFVSPSDTNYLFSLLESARGNIGGSGFPTLSVIAAIFVATGVFTELQSGLNSIWNVTSQRGSSIIRYIEMRLISFLIVLGIGVLLLISLATSTILSTLEAIIAQAFPLFANNLSKINSLISLAVIPLLVAFSYKLIPATEITWGDILPGSILASLLLLIGKFFISMYLNLSRISSLYGAAGSLVILLVWVYYSAQVFFFGAEFTKVYAYRLGSRKQSTSEGDSILPL